MAASYTLLVDWNNDGDFTDSNDDISGDTLSVEGRGIIPPAAPCHR